MTNIVAQSSSPLRTVLHIHNSSARGPIAAASRPHQLFRANCRHSDWSRSCIPHWGPQKPAGVCWGQAPSKLSPPKIVRMCAAALPCLMPIHLVGHANSCNDRHPTAICIHYCVHILSDMYVFAMIYRGKLWEGRRGGRSADHHTMVAILRCNPAGWDHRGRSVMMGKNEEK